MRQYFYSLLAQYISVYVRPEDTVTELDAMSSELSQRLRDVKASTLAESSPQGAERNFVLDADYVVLNGVLHYERDILRYLQTVHASTSARSRLIVTYYNNLYRPLFTLFSWLGLRIKAPENNWLSHHDIANLLYLSDFEIIKLEQKVLLPVYIPLISPIVNRYLAPLAVLRELCLVNIVLARPISRPFSASVSASIVIPARNEAGNIEQAVLRTPQMGPSDEMIFVEGGSSDDTWETILKVQLLYGTTRKILAVRQEGKGKGDAVRKGFSMASNEVLMILDADLTVAPEDLPKFFAALISGKGELINGSRLVYPMEKKAMRFLNMVGNKFFATAFSFVLGQQLKDTLCGTKVLAKRNYERLARSRSYFGEFDPFGDFDLLFGASRMGLKIVEIPIAYRERTYGVTNIARWRHGLILLGMLLFACRRLKFI